MQKFQFEYEEQVQVWKKEKGELMQKMQDLANHLERVKYDSHEAVENYKGKYSEYKQKLKKANQSIQTLTSRVAKYELAMAAEREIGRVDSGIRVGRHGQRSSDGAISPGLVNPEFNIGDYNNEFENQELNEEIKKLLMENQI